MGNVVGKLTGADKQAKAMRQAAEKQAQATEQAAAAARAQQAQEAAASRQAVQMSKEQELLRDQQQRIWQEQNMAEDSGEGSAEVEVDVAPTGTSGPTSRRRRQQFFSGDTGAGLNI